MSQMTLDLPRADLTGIIHVCLPNFSLACGIDFLEKPSGDRVILGAGKDWHKVTCVWCRCQGRAYLSSRVQAMQGRQA